jgi:hypothetical protein
MLDSELRLLLILIKENVKRFYSVILDSLYLVGVESCEPMKNVSFRRFWWVLEMGRRVMPKLLRPLVGHQAALLALNTLREYEEQNEHSNGAPLRYLRAYEKDIYANYRKS